MSDFLVQRIFSNPHNDESWEDRCQQYGVDPRGVFKALPYGPGAADIKIIVGRSVWYSSRKYWRPAGQAKKSLEDFL